MADIFDVLYKIRGDIEEVMGLIEILNDTETVYDEWTDGDYLEAGLYTGKGVINAYFVIYQVYSSYF